MPVPYNLRLFARNLGCTCGYVSAVLTLEYSLKDVKKKKQKIRVRKPVKAKRGSTQPDTASGNTSHIPFRGLLHAFYDKKWRDSAVDTRHQSLPTTLPFGPLSSPTAAPITQPLFRHPSTRLSVIMLKKLPCHLYLFFAKIY